MKNILISLLIIVIASCQHSEKVFKKELHTNGEIAAIGYLENEVKVGTWYEFDEKGYLTFEFTYINGELSGRSLEYRNGKLFGVYNFEDGKISGESKLYRNNGQSL